ncbi:hypothetical protein [Pseudomonas sp. efr-133-TYG-5]|jgi:hypothetical protein|uniref:hypothetical protein n=1 Tax=Pseudomonas sp. efr-133-TYG-5 TaxID=3040310 RepID=UPI002552DE5E|nr:hypothetical protein [Pseudomonas sp. efr-133-TYG-5]
MNTESVMKDGTGKSEDYFVLFQQMARSIAVGNFFVEDGGTYAVAQKTYKIMERMGKEQVIVGLWTTRIITP